MNWLIFLIALLVASVVTFISGSFWAGFLCGMFLLFLNPTPPKKS